MTFWIEQDVPIDLWLIMRLEIQNWMFTKVIRTPSALWNSKKTRAFLMNRGKVISWHCFAHSSGCDRLHTISSIFWWKMDPARMKTLFEIWIFHGKRAPSYIFQKANGIFEFRKTDQVIITFVNVQLCRFTDIGVRSIRGRPNLLESGNCDFSPCTDQGLKFFMAEFYLYRSASYRK